MGISNKQIHGALSLDDRWQMLEENIVVLSLKGLHLLNGRFEPSRRDHFALWQHWAAITQLCCVISEKNGDLSNVSCKLCVLCACTQVMKSVHIGNWIVHIILNLKNMVIKKYGLRFKKIKIVQIVLIFICIVNCMTKEWNNNHSNLLFTFYYPLYFLFC
jgi:hypothetical protein